MKYNNIENLSSSLIDLIIKSIKKHEDIFFIEEFFNKKLVTNNKDEYFYWSPLTLSHGLPSLIILYMNLEKLFPSEGWEIKSLNLIQYMQRYIHRYLNDISLFGGITGIAIAIFYVSKQGTRYQLLLDKLDNIIIQKTNYILQNIDINSLYPSTFDTISGISGIGRYLIERINNKNCDKLNITLKKILEKLQEIHHNKNSKYSWWISQKNQFTKDDFEKYKYGNYNLGLAHGVLGPFSLFAICYKKSFQIANHETTLYSMYEYLANFIQYDDDNLPYYYQRPFINLEQGNKISHLDDELYRNGWCYGNISGSRVLYLISVALNDKKIESLSISMLKKSLLFGYKLLDSPTFCHGLSGYLQILISMFVSLNNNMIIKNELFNQIIQITKILISLYSDSNPFGFSNIEYIKNDRIVSDEIGILTGSSGVLSVLINVYQLLSKKSVSIEWSSIFLIN